HLLQTGGHDRKLHLLAPGDLALLVAGDDAADRLDRDLVCRIADDQAKSFISGLERELPRLVAKGNARIWIQDRFVEGILSQLAADLGKVRPEISPLPFDLMAIGTAGGWIGKHFRAVSRIASHFHQLGHGWE